MQKLQDTFLRESEITERNKFRQADDMQFGFSYYYFLMSEMTKLTISNIFDKFDTDDSGYCITASHHLISVYSIKIKKHE